MSILGAATFGLAGAIGVAAGPVQAPPPPTSASFEPNASANLAAAITPLPMAPGLRTQSTLAICNFDGTAYKAGSGASRSMRITGGVSCYAHSGSPQMNWVRVRGVNYKLNDSNQLVGMDLVSGYTIYSEGHWSVADSQITVCGENCTAKGAGEWTHQIWRTTSYPVTLGRPGGPMITGHCWADAHAAGCSDVGYYDSNNQKRFGTPSGVSG